MGCSSTHNIRIINTDNYEAPPFVNADACCDLILTCIASFISRKGHSYYHSRSADEEKQDLER